MSESHLRKTVRAQTKYRQLSGERSEPKTFKRNARTDTQPTFPNARCSVMKNVSWERCNAPPSNCYVNMLEALSRVDVRLNHLNFKTFSINMLSA